MKLCDAETVTLYVCYIVQGQHLGIMSIHYEGTEQS